MTDFAAGGSSSINDGGKMFTDGTEDLECVISEELALYNDLDVGDTVIFTNPNNEEETYEFTITGIYTSTQSNTTDFSSMMGATSLDPANKVYTSYNALALIIGQSEENSTTMTDENTGREYETALTSSLSATYVFADVESYEKFEEEARELGLSDEYTISSSDVASYENSITPLTTLSKIAGYFLLVILGIGAIVLIVLNIFNVRERKYEIGVLCAMGMKKGKVAAQFLCEIFVVTLVAVIIGAVIGGVCAVPVTNALLDSQIAKSEANLEEVQENFGGMEGNMPGMGMGGMGGMGFPGGGFNPEDAPEDIPEGFIGDTQEYITEIDSAMNLTVVLQMLGIAILLTLAAGAVSMLFVMRYDPLKILANRD